jgi:hypothetical protein
VTSGRGVEARRVRKGGVAGGGGSRAVDAAAGSRRTGLVEEEAGRHEEEGGGGVVGKNKVGGRRSLVGYWWVGSSRAYASSRSHIGPPPHQPRNLIYVPEGSTRLNLPLFEIM